MALKSILLIVQLIILLLIFLATCESKKEHDGVEFMKVWAEERQKILKNGIKRVKLTAKQQKWWDSLSSKHRNYGKPSAKFRSKANNPIDYIDGPLHTRQEYRQMTREEQTRYHKAVVATMNTFPDDTDGLSQFGVFVRQHQTENSPGAHIGPAFHPWHREFVFRFEKAIQSHDPTVSVPYWDPRLDRLLPEPHDSIMWTADHFGNGDGNVTTGPYAYAPSIPECEQYGLTLTRLLQSRDNLYTHEQVHWMNFQGFYSNFTCLAGDPTCKVEADHGNVHEYFGIQKQVGHLTQLPCAPSDPMFYSHHGFVDWMWENFRQNYQVTNPTRDYPTPELYSTIPQYHNWNDPMLPFEDIINAHGMGNHYTSYYYKYSETPSEINCNADEECGGSFLWCNQLTSQCAPQIRQGGQCEGLPDSACVNDCASNEIAACDRESGKCYCRSI